MRHMYDVVCCIKIYEMVNRHLKLLCICRYRKCRQCYENLSVIRSKVAKRMGAPGKVGQLLREIQILMASIDWAQLNVCDYFLLTQKHLSIALSGGWLVHVKILRCFGVEYKPENNLWLQCDITKTELLEQDYFPLCRFLWWTSTKMMLACTFQALPMIFHIYKVDQTPLKYLHELFQFLSGLFSLSLYLLSEYNFNATQVKE